MKKQIILVLSIFSVLMTFSQEFTYFNKVYNPMGSYARGRGIVQIGDYYYSLTNTFDSSNNYQSFLLIKLDYDGNIVNQNLFHITNTDLYPGYVGGTLKENTHKNLFFAYHSEYMVNGNAYSSLVEFDTSLNILWRQDYETENKSTMTMNCNQTDDGGYILSGAVHPASGEYLDFLLIKTDSLGNKQWYQTYGTEWSEWGQNAIQTPDGGYLIGGFYWKPGWDHSMDAMVVKTDSLGNEQWTKYFGNPNIDDDMAFVAMADDGNYLVATSYGEIITTPDSRFSRIYLLKINLNGEIIWEEKIGDIKRSLYMKKL